MKSGNNPLPILKEFKLIGSGVNVDKGFKILQYGLRSLVKITIQLAYKQ